MSAREPDFIIIGAMKCGTSTLHEQLAANDSFFMSDPKEPNFFSDDENFKRGYSWYTSLFADARPDQICGESSTHYTKLPTYPHAVERMRERMERVKLVYVMRDPIDRMVSQYIHEWTQREVKVRFEEAVLNHERFVAYSCYARQLEPYLAAYGRERILPIAFEHMLASPDRVLEQICEFLERPPAIALTWRQDLGPQNVSSERLRRSRIRETLLAVPAIRAAKDALPAGVREAVKSPWKMNRRPKLRAALRKRVEERIDSDLEKLGRLLERDLSCRTWKDAVRTTPLAWAE